LYVINFRRDELRSNEQNEFTEIRNVSPSGYTHLGILEIFVKWSKRVKQKKNQLEPGTRFVLKILKVQRSSFLFKKSKKSANR